MNCPKCENPFLEKARLDVYWCMLCGTSWLIHKLQYKSLDAAAELYDEGNLAVFAVPPKL